MSKLDYYNGRPFVRVIQNEDGEESEWGIELEGGVLIRNHDGRRTIIPDENLFKGTSFLGAIFDEQHTTLHFGYSNKNGSTVVGEIQFTPTLYSVADNDYTGGAEIYPQADTPEEDVLPPDPSNDRVAEGPTEPPVGAAEGVSEATEPQEASQ